MTDVAATDLPEVTPAAVGTVPNVAPDAPITSAWGNIVADDINLLLNPPSCVLAHSADQSHTTSGSFQAVAFDTEEVDTAAMHASPNTRVAITRTGLYRFEGNVQFGTSAVGTRVVGFRVNGTGVVAPTFGRTQQPAASPAAELGMTVAGSRKLTAGDWVELCAFQDTGGALPLKRSGAEYPRLSATYVGNG